MEKLPLFKVSVFLKASLTSQTLLKIWFSVAKAPQPVLLDITNRSVCTQHVHATYAHHILSFLRHSLTLILESELSPPSSVLCQSTVILISILNLEQQLFPKSHHCLQPEAASFQHKLTEETRCFLTIKGELGGKG